MVGETATPASDVYSLGVMLFEILNGALPSSQQSAERLRPSNHGTGLRLQAPSACSDLDVSCEQMTRFEPAARPTVAELRAALDADGRLPFGPSALPGSSVEIVG